MIDGMIMPRPHHAPRAHDMDMRTDMEVTTMKLKSTKYQYSEREARPVNFVYRLSNDFTADFMFHLPGVPEGGGGGFCGAGVVTGAELAGCEGSVAFATGFSSLSVCGGAVWGAAACAASACATAAATIFSISGLSGAAVACPVFSAGASGGDSISFDLVLMIVRGY